jgi:branched-chain amino acid aminotransferase
MAGEAEAQSRGADDALFLANGDVVLEAPISNVWWRAGETLFTPALDVGVLAGVTRATLLELAPAAGYRVEEGRFPVADVRAADEAFTSSSIREVLPVVELDGEPIGDGRPGTAARALQRALRDRATGPVT